MKLIMRATGEPATEPFTIGQLRDQVRADDNIDDAALLGFGVAARQLVEAWLGQPIIARTVAGSCEAWPATGSLSLSMPITSIDQITYTAIGQSETVWDAALWVARKSQGGVTSIRPATGQRWPDLGDDPVIAVTATAGLATVPEPIITAIAKLAAYLHADRDGIGDPNMGLGRIPGDIRELVAPWRWRLLA